MSETRTASHREGLRWRRLTLLAVAIMGIGLGVWVRARPPLVKVTRARHTDIEQTVVATGQVLAPARVNLGLLVQGVVAKVLVTEGQHVNAGDLLLTLEDEELQALVKQARGNLGLANARLRQVSAVDARIAAEQLARTTKELEKATADYERVRKLVSTGALPSSDATDAEAALARAKEQHELASIRVHSTKAGGLEAQSSLASITNAQGVVDYAATRLKYGRIVAPAAGTVISRDVEPGDVVSPGKTLLLLARDGDTRLLIQPDEHALSALAVGQAAEASAEAFRHLAFPARVDWIAPAVDSSRGTIDVKLLVPQAPDYLKPEMTVQVTVHGAMHMGVLVVDLAHVFDPDSNQPYVVLANRGILEHRAVRLGLRSSQAVEIVAGLTEQDWVVASLDSLPARGSRVRTRVSD